VGAENRNIAFTQELNSFTPSPEQASEFSVFRGDERRTRLEGINSEMGWFPRSLRAEKLVAATAHGGARHLRQAAVSRLLR